MLSIIITVVSLASMFALGAIVDSPLLSLGARKTLGKTITFMRLKGQNIARQRVIPANPRSAAQQAQRGLMGTAVTQYQSGGLTSTDKSAYDRWASAAYRKLSGYNLFVRQILAWLKSGNDAAVIKEVSLTHDGGDTAVASVEFPAGNTGQIRIGDSKTSQPDAVDLVDGEDDTYSATVEGLVDDVTYYFYVTINDPLTAEQEYRSGLYSYTHTA